MKTPITSDIRIEEINPLISPAVLAEDYPITDSIAKLTLESRKIVQDIIHGKDDRLIGVVGPCSVHDIDSGLKYAEKLQKYAQSAKDELFLIMRCYFEKPRTTLGWKGLINDPYLDNSFKINKGLKLARKFLLDVNNVGLPCGTEFLDVIIPQFIADIISWGAIGARTTESQIHRELSSGISAPIGFKNGTGGNIQLAIDAIIAASNPHHFLSVTRQGLTAIITTQGNKDCHIILRGGKSNTNYDEKSIKEVADRLTKANLPPYIMVDCSHANSFKDHKQQINVANDISKQIAEGNQNIVAFMLESFLIEGNQKIDIDNLKYGQSVTDACMNWEDTVKVLDNLRRAVDKRRKSKN